MIKLDVIGLVFVCLPFWVRAQINHAATPALLAYQLRWDGKSSLLQVSLEYTPAASDSTVFVYGNPNFGGQKQIFKVLRNIVCNDSVKLTPAERKITVYHTRPGVQTISYTINGQLVGNPRRSTVDELFRPLLTPNFLYLVPQFFMLQPIGHQAKVASMQWRTFPARVPYFTSTSPLAKPNAKQFVRLDKLEDELILMGQGLQIKTYQVHGIPYYAITEKNETANNLTAQLAPFFKNYFPGLRNYWNDDSAPYYYISVLPLLAIDKPWATGFSQTHGFVMRYSGQFGDEKKRVLAHETNHAWIGNSLQIGNDEFDNQWFGEGFNDYVMLVNLVRAGIQTKAAFLDYVNNDNLRAHYSSQVKNAPNDSIAAKFWVDQRYQTLPYKRGFIYAFYFDNQIRLASGGRYTIRNFLLNLLARNKKIRTINPDAHLSIGDYIAAAGKYMPEKQVRAELETYLLQGKPLDFKQVKLIKGFTISYQDSIPVLAMGGDASLQKMYGR